ncbi:TetR/AcrR family transcriptional regulator C-terminal domain-containing protein [Kitasatospora sp. GP82]|uniref:TetR/AcrR family transcriptional regulator C-terminal domain-containing protein n=1 Tax=Kitasatospora sp. GP82 TaxID=3035089 RepID=UPI00247313C4|nr:TetR/AcrR family transcriptional regulator C-terminal domain-containing protein [Kitasatospora sp. GP82]MDH6124137.1 TetR/AcrR family tetracycline transcriptional repressor [Kitasatospora sp. GP82]
MPLRQSDVLRGAMELLDEVGLDELTTRRLADRLGVRAGALYWHYPSKAALLDALAEQIIGEVSIEPAATGDWADRLRELAVRARESVLAHRDGARVVASFTAPPPAAVRFMRTLIDTLRSAGASEEDAAIGADAVTSFVNGYTLEEQARKVGIVPARLRDATFARELAIVISGIRAELLER